MTQSDPPYQIPLPSKRIFDWLDEVENPPAEVPRDASSCSQRARRALRPRGILTSTTSNIMATPERAGKRRRIEHNAEEEPSTPLHASQLLEDTDDTPRPGLQQRMIVEEGSNGGRSALSRRASSGSLASSSSTKSSASTKSNSSSKLGILAELEVADIPLTYTEFASAMGLDAIDSQKLPEDALKIYEDLDGYSTGSGAIPGVLKVRSNCRIVNVANDFQEELSQRNVVGERFLDHMYTSIDERAQELESELQKARALLKSVKKIQQYTLRCIRENDAEPGWNIYVHTRVLKTVLKGYTGLDYRVV